MSKTEDSTRRPARGPRLGLAQVAPVLGALAANLERHRSAVEKAVAEGTDLLVFPELSLAGYRLKDSVPDVAIRRGSDTWKELLALSADVALVVGFVEETGDHLFYNSAAYLEGGKCLAVHRKSYLPTYGMFDEQRYFARGRGIAAFDTKLGRVAMLVCEDMLHPSAVTIAACDGATLLVVPSASPARGVTGEGEADSNARSWESYNRVMARSFGVWVAYCNRVGVEDGVTFWGGSEVISPAGDVVAKAAYYDEDTTAAVLSDDAVRRRRIVNPLVRDEDLDLTINELSRIRGRAVAKAATEEKAAAPRERFDARPAREGGERPPRRFDDERPPRRFDEDRPPRRFDDDRPPRRFDGDRPPRRFDGDAPPRRNFDGPPRPFDRDAPRPFRPQGGGFHERGQFKGPRMGGAKPGFASPPRGDREEGGFGGKPRFGDKPGFGGKPRFGDKPGFGDRPRFGDKPGFGGKPRSGDKPGFGDRPRFGDKPGFGDRPRFGDKPGFGDKGGFGDRPRFGDKGGFGGAPRDRERPERGGKPFHKGAKPRGRKDD
jgi:NAD+ synthase (glutamine-hydrolysing)